MLFRRTVGRLLLPVLLCVTPLQGQSATPPAPPEEEGIPSLAYSFLGIRYLWGGTDPDRGFDCSGFTRYLMQALDIWLPRTANEQAKVGLEIPPVLEALRIGDLLTFGTNGSRVSHIGVYIGRGRFIHASSGQGKVVVAQLQKSGMLGKKKWLGARRVLDCPECLPPPQPH